MIDGQFWVKCAAHPYTANFCHLYYSLKSFWDSRNRPFVLIQILTTEQAHFCHFENLWMIQIQTWQFSADQSIWSSCLSFYVTCLLGITPIQVMPYCSYRPPRALSFFSTKTKALLFFHLSHFHFILAVCVSVCPDKRICLKNLHCLVVFDQKRCLLTTICLLWSIY